MPEQGDQPPYEDPPPACAAALRENADVLRAMLEAAAASEPDDEAKRALAIGRVLNVSNGGGHSPLKLAACNDHTTCIEVLLEFCQRAATIAMPDQVYGGLAYGWCSPLCGAIERNHDDSVRLLLEAGYELAPATGGATRRRPRRPTKAAPFQGTEDDYCSACMDHQPLSHADSAARRRALLKMAHEVAAEADEKAQWDVEASRPGPAASTAEPAAAAPAVVAAAAPVPAAPGAAPLTGGGSGAGQKRRPGGLLPAALKAAEGDLSLGQCCGRGREQSAFDAYRDALSSLRAFLSSIGTTTTTTSHGDAAASDSAPDDAGGGAPEAKRPRLLTFLAGLPRFLMAPQKPTGGAMTEEAARFRELLAALNAAREEVKDLWVEAALTIGARQAAIGAWPPFPLLRSLPAVRPLNCCSHLSARLVQTRRTGASRWRS